MTIQSILHPEKPKSKFVTVIGWLGILVGANYAMGGVLAIAFGWHVGVATLAGLVGGIGAMVAGAGLNQREEWARKGFIFVQAYGMLTDVVTFVSRPLSTPSVIGCALVLALGTWIILKLSSAAVRAEFEDEE